MNSVELSETLTEWAKEKFNEPFRYFSEAADYVYQYLKEHTVLILPTGETVNYVDSFCDKHKRIDKGECWMVISLNAHLFRFEGEYTSWDSGYSMIAWEGTVLQAVIAQEVTRIEYFVES
jgi:hypothetical protein